MLYLIILINSKHFFSIGSSHFYAEVPTVLSAVYPYMTHTSFSIFLSYMNTDTVSRSVLSPLKYNAKLSHILGRFRKMSLGSELCRHVFGHTAVNLVKPVSCSGHFLLSSSYFLPSGQYTEYIEAYWRSKTKNLRKYFWKPNLITIYMYFTLNTSYCQILDSRQKLCSEKFEDLPFINSNELSLL